MLKCAESSKAFVPCLDTKHVRDELFETATRRSGARRRLPTGGVGRYRPRVVVSMMVVVVLVGGALYTARLSEGTPRVVYTASLEEVGDES